MKDYAFRVQKAEQIARGVNNFMVHAITLYKERPDLFKFLHENKFDFECDAESGPHNGFSEIYYYIASSKNTPQKINLDVETNASGTVRIFMSGEDGISSNRHVKEIIFSFDSLSVPSAISKTLASIIEIGQSDHFTLLLSRSLEQAFYSYNVEIPACLCAPKPQTP